MFKKIVSMLAALSIISSMPLALAENTDASDIVNTKYFTEGNVIYNALQCADGGAALYSADSADESEGITADFDVVLGLDMSSAMYGFDYNGEMEWLDDFRALYEQVPDGTRFSVVTDETTEFSDLDAQFDKLTGKTYSGESDIVTLLDECLNTFDSTDRNNVVIATAAEVSDATALSDKMDELTDCGVVPVDIVLQFERKLIGVIYDKFGENTQMISTGKDSFAATVKVHISPTFWGWIFQFAGQMQILSPPELAQRYRERAAVIVNEGQIEKQENSQSAICEKNEECIHL